MGKVQKICKQENETLCRQINRVANQVSALPVRFCCAVAQQQQAPDSNQGSILDVMRTKLDEKIGKLAKAQLNTSTLAEIFFIV